MRTAIPYTLIRSARRTLAITVTGDGNVVVRAPKHVTKRQVEAFLWEKEAWILRAQEKVRERRALSENGADPLTEEELRELKKRAKAVLVPMVAALSEEIGVSYGKISIRAQKTRWGSCSSTGNLNFNCLLMLLPEHLVKYVVVHELCHRREMNHSAAFWAEVGKYQPTYREDRKELREKGGSVLSRLR